MNVELLYMAAWLTYLVVWVLPVLLAITAAEWVVRRAVRRLRSGR